jgi:hypothetical protein
MPFISFIGDSGPRDLLKLLQSAAPGVTWDCALDAGALASYPGGTEQQWSDLTASAAHFNRGDNDTAEGDDPVFVGVAGDLLGTTYFECDGTDKFQSTVRHAVFDNYHRTNEAFSMVVVANIPDAVDSFSFGGIGNRSFQIVMADELGRLDLRRVNNAGTVGVSDVFFTLDLVVPLGEWGVFVTSWDDQGGADNLKFACNADLHEQTEVLAAGTDDTRNVDYELIGSDGVLFGGLATCNVGLSAAQIGSIYERVRDSDRWPIP